MNLSLDRVYIKKGRFEIKYISENNRYCIVDDVDAMSSLHRHHRLIFPKSSTFKTLQCFFLP